MKKQIVSETKNYQPSTVDELLLDDAPKVNSFNGVTSDGVARAIAGASGEVPQVTENDNGKVLTAIYDEGGAAVEWAEATVDQTYDATSTNAQSGVAVAQAIAAIPSASYTAGDGISIADDEISTRVGKGLEFGTSLSPVSTTAHAIGATLGVTVIQKLNASLVSAIETDGITYTLQNLIDDSETSQPWIYSTSDKKLYPTIGRIYTNFLGDKTVDLDTILVLSTTGVTMSTMDGNVPAGTQFVYNLNDINTTLSTTDWSTISASPANYTLCVMGYVEGSKNVLKASGIYMNGYSYDSGTLSYQSEVPGAITVSNPLPASAVGDAGKVLTVNAQGTPAWATAGGGSSYTAGDGININNNEISVRAGDGLELGTFTGALKVSNPLPASTVSDAGKILTVNSSGAPAWGMLGSVTSIQQVNALPATPDANTLYLIPEA